MKRKYEEFPEFCSETGFFSFAGRKFHIKPIQDLSKLLPWLVIILVVLWQFDYNKQFNGKEDFWSMGSLYGLELQL